MRLCLCFVILTLSTESRKTGNSTVQPQTAKTGWSKAADIVPYALRTSHLGKSLLVWFIRSNFDFKVNAGGNVEFSCKNSVTINFSKENPMLRWLWVKDGDPVKLDASRMLLTDFIFYVEDMRLTDSGTYECRMDLGDGTVLTAEVYTLTVLTSGPTLFVRQTEPLRLDCRSEALNSVRRIFKVSLQLQKEDSHRGKRDAEDTSIRNGADVITGEPGFRNVAQAGHGGVRGSGSLEWIGETTSRFKKRQASQKAQGDKKEDPITMRRWYFNDKETPLFPKSFPEDVPSPDVLPAAEFNMTGEWTCKVSDLVTRHTWRTAWYRVKVAPPPSVGEGMVRRLLVHPQVVGAVVAAVVALLLTLAVLVARVAQKRSAKVEEEFAAMKERMLRRPRHGGTSDEERQMLKRTSSRPGDAKSRLSLRTDVSTPTDMEETEAAKSRLSLRTDVWTPTDMEETEAAKSRLSLRTDVWTPTDMEEKEEAKSRLSLRPGVSTTTDTGEREEEQVDEGYTDDEENYNHNYYNFGK